jgi:hypothetical protein
MFKKLFGWLFGSKSSKSKDPLSQQNDLVYETRTAIEKGLRDQFRKIHGDKAKQVAEIVTNYIFDFGEFGFDFSTGKDLKKTVGAELVNVCNYKLVDPNRLCQAMVHRALQMKHTGETFDSHMRDLWILCLIPVGPLTPPDSAFLPVHQNFVKRVREIEITPAQAKNCLAMWDKNPQLQSALNAYIAKG